MDNDQTDEDTEEHSQEEWMFLCQLQPTYDTPGNSPDSHENTQVNWDETANQMPPQLLLSCPNWVKEMKIPQG